MKKKSWRVVKFNNRRILMRRTRNGYIKLLFKRLDDSGEGVTIEPLLLSSTAMDALCVLWAENRDAWMAKGETP